MASRPPRPPYNGNSQQRPKVPRYHHKKKGCTCLTCICWCCLFLILATLALAGLMAYFFAFYRPRVPSYSLQGFEVQAFSVLQGFTLLTEFLVTVKAENPNTDIGFFYWGNNSVIVTYKETELCSGKIPSFYQGEKNTTMIKILLKGNIEFGSGIQEAYSDSEKSGKIPLLVQVKLPVSIVISDIQLRRFRVLLNCSVVVNNLRPNQNINILSSSYVYDVDFTL